MVGDESDVVRQVIFVIWKDMQSYLAYQLPLWVRSGDENSHGKSVW